MVFSAARKTIKIEFSVDAQLGQQPQSFGVSGHDKTERHRDTAATFFRNPGCVVKMARYRQRYLGGSPKTLGSRSLA